MDVEPLVIERLGLRFRPPVNCIMRADGADNSTQWTVTERAASPKFVLRFSRIVTNDPESTPAKQIDGYIAEMSKPAPDAEAATFALRDRRDLRIADVPAGLVYATLRDPDGIAMIRGYLLLQMAPSQFIVMSILMAETDFAAVSPLLDRSFRTMELLTLEEASAARRERLQRGDEFLQHLDEDALRTALDPVAADGKAPTPRWYRLSRRLPDGTEQESGYLTVVAVEAPQGAANPSRDERVQGPRVWTDGEEEMGLLVRVMIRTLLDDKGTAVADTEARYWMRWDRQREFWTSRTTRRVGKKSQSSTQLGVRAAPTAGRLRPVLEVSDAREGELSATPRRFQVPEVAYISLAEAMVLPRLLAREAGAGDYGFNWFNPQLDRPAQRRDVLRRAATGFTLETQGALETPSLSETLGSRGELLRLESDDGSITQAIEPSELLKLWRQKGLPTG